jgi:hypothetical protein
MLKFIYPRSVAASAITAAKMREFKKKRKVHIQEVQLT